MRDTLDKAGVVAQDRPLRHAAGHAFYNTSRFTMRDLKARASQQRLRADFEAYLDGFSPNMQDVIDNFEFRNQIPRLARADALGTLIEKLTSPDVNLSPYPVKHPDGSVKLPGLDNHGMGTIFEELVRRFNEEAGEHWTPRDTVRLMAHLVFLPVAGEIESSTYLLYDGTCGTGGMLTVAVEFPNRVLLVNIGDFLPGDVETVIRQDAPQALYRNPFLARAMVELNLIDTQGGGIRRMFGAQRKRSFPLPDYDLAETNRVAVSIRGGLERRICAASRRSALDQHSPLPLRAACARTRSSSSAPVSHLTIQLPTSSSSSGEVRRSSRPDRRSAVRAPNFSAAKRSSSARSSARPFSIPSASHCAFHSSARASSNVVILSSSPRSNSSNDGNSARPSARCDHNALAQTCNPSRNASFPSPGKRAISSRTAPATPPPSGCAANVSTPPPGSPAANRAHSSPRRQRDGTLGAGTAPAAAPPAARRTPPSSVALDNSGPHNPLPEASR